MWVFRASEGMLAQKLATLASTIFLIQWMEINSIQGYLQGNLFSIHTNYPVPFCHTNFINQEEVIEHMEICWGTDLKPEVLKLTCPYCQPTFETYENIEKHIQIQFMRLIRNLQNLSQEFQKPETRS